MYLSNFLFAPQKLKKATLLLLVSLFVNALKANEVPNVIVVLVDDMGYSDPGFMGGESKTPHLKNLAKNGVHFLNCFNNAKCAPSRAALMTGMTCQRVKAFQSAGNIEKNNATTIAEVLGQDGYVTIKSGKWHIEPSPLEVGFQYDFGMSLGPLYFKKDVLSNPKTLKREGVEVDGHSLPDDWFSTIAYTDYAIEKIEEKAISKEKPFFLYLALNAPHFPLSAPKEVVDKYEGVYDGGIDYIREKRYKRMVDLGIIDPTFLKLPVMNSYKKKTPTWEQFSPKEKRLFKRKLQLVAAMVDVVDQQIGKLVSFLENKNQLENTVFIFLSDNGASAETGIYGGCDLDNMTDKEIDQLGTREGIRGRNNSGPIVANVQNTPFREDKSSLWEGGMRTSMIVHWPAFTKNKATQGFQRAPVCIYDLAPTIYDATGTSYPNQMNGRSLNKMDGVSILPILEGKPIDNRYIRFAYQGFRAIRDKNFKLLGSNGLKQVSWSLFNINKDQSEIENVIQQFPEKAQELISEWDRFDKYANITMGYKSYKEQKSRKNSKKENKTKTKNVKKNL